MHQNQQLHLTIYIHSYKLEKEKPVPNILHSTTLTQAAPSLSKLKRIQNRGCVQSQTKSRKGPAQICTPNVPNQQIEISTKIQYKKTAYYTISAIQFLFSWIHISRHRLLAMNFRARESRLHQQEKCSNKKNWYSQILLAIARPGC